MLRDRLREKGFATVERVLTAAECEQCVRVLRRDADASHAHSDLMWRLRTHPKVGRAFARVWECDELVSSFDGASLRDADDDAFVLGWHVDQDGTHERGCVCVQAVLALAPMNARTGGTALVAGSHVAHEAVCARCWEDRGEAWEYVPVPVTDPAVVAEDIVQPSIEAGTLLVWDSRTIHCVRPPRDPTTVRAVAYLSMVPRAFVSDEVAARRADAFRRGVATTHWSSRCVDRGDGRMPPSRAVRASRLVQRLV